MATALIPMTAANSLKLSGSTMKSETQVKNDQALSLFAAELKGKMPPAEEPVVPEKMTPEKLLKALQQLLQNMQDMQADPRVTGQIKKAMDTLKQLMNVFSEKGGILPLDSLETTERPKQEAKTEDVQNNNQWLGWFAQQIQMILSSLQEGQHGEQQENVKSLFASLENTVRRLQQILAGSSEDSNGDSPTKAWRPSGQEMSAEKESADSSPAARPQNSETQRPGLLGKQEARQTASQQTTKGAPGRFSVKAQREDKGQTIAQSAFRRVFASEGKRDAATTGSASFFNFQSGPMSHLEQLVVHARQGGGTAQEQQFLRDFRQMLVSSALQNNGGRQQLTMKLYPRHLGTLNIQLTQEEGQMTATFITSTAAAKQLVDSQLSQLRNAFTHQNLHLDRLQVLMPSGQAQADPTHDSRGEQQDDQGEHQHGDEQPEEDEEETESSFSEWLQEAHLL